MLVLLRARRGNSPAFILSSALSSIGKTHTVIMSRACTVGPRAQTQTGRGARVNPAKKSPNTRTVGAGRSSTKQARTLPSVACQTKSSGSDISPPKPRVVTLTDLNSVSRKSNTKPQPTRSSKVSTPGVNNSKLSNTSGTKTGQTTKMWDDSFDDSSTMSTSQRGNRNVVVSNHGNGRQIQGQQTYPNSVNVPGSSESNSGADGQEANVDRRGIYNPQGGYTLVQPDPKKRTKLQSQRSEELGRLEAYKEKNKLGHVSIKPSRVGGSKMSEEEARRKQQREQENRKYELIRKREQWAEEKKKREEAEYAEKKAKAREQTERNKQRELERQTQRHAERQDWIACGGLDRLEGGATGRVAPEGMYEGEEECEIDEGAVDYLAELFPLKRRSKLSEMLSAACGDINKVIDWLSN